MIHPDGHQTREYPALWLSTEIDSTWQERAACRHHPELEWTPRVWPGRPAMAELSAVCADCPVRAQCAQWALHHQVTTGAYAGVWVPDFSPKWGPIRNRGWMQAREQLAQIAIEEDSQ